MVVVTIRGLAVDFPFEPYESQRAYMTSVVEALQSGQHALLESPTGTGKTLCLLCATLAWRETFVASLQAEGRGSETTVNESAATAGRNRSNEDGSLLSNLVDGLSGDGSSQKKAAPRIIYSSRTHSQLSQVIRELRRTRYRPKTSILGSRAQMCIHRDVSKVRGAAQNAQCSLMVSKRKCHLKNELDARREKMIKMVLETPRDIEDVVRLGEAQGVCPFYLSRDAYETSDIVLLPYNYIFDRQARQALGTDWSNDIIIFDEAHNIDAVCTESLSFDLTSANREACIKELLRCEKLSGSSAGSEETSSLLNFERLRTALEALEVQIAKEPIREEYFSGLGDRFLDTLACAGFTAETEKLFRAQLESARTFLQTELGPGASSTGLTSFCEALDICFDTSRAQLKDHYRLCISVEREYNAAGSIQSHFQGRERKGGRTVSLWCMNPGSAMQSIVSRGVRSILLTSGTLSPLEGTERELGIHFATKLENRHVITNDQVWVSTVSRGPRGVSLNSSYKNRDSEQYVMDMGSAILNFARVVPEGILVFFPSYQTLSKALTLWKRRIGTESTSIYDQIEQRKRIVVEPREAVSFQDALDQHEHNVKNGFGGILMAVCRGKTSEGLDFPDELARAVVLTGIPYPQLNNPKVTLKRNYLDSRRSGDGGKWYAQAALRAVNQAIGRVIRHRDDYGAVILCDERFAGGDVKKRLSSWLRPQLTVFQEFGAGQKSLADFFRRCIESPFAARRKRAIEETSMEENRRMRKRCEVESVISGILPQRPSETEDTARKDDSTPRQKVVSELLPAVRKELGSERYRQFIVLLKDAKLASSERAGGHTENASALVRSCFRRLHELLGHSDAGVEILRVLIQFIPANLKDDYRRFVLGFLLRKTENGNEGIVGLLKATRLSLGETDYVSFRRLLAQLKALDDTAGEEKVEVLFQKIRDLFVHSIPPAWNPTASDLLGEWREFMPLKWKVVYERITRRET